MQVQKQEQQPDEPQNHTRFPWGPFSFVCVVLLLIAFATTIWIYVGTDAGILFTILFTAFVSVFTFLQLTPSLFSHTPKPVPTANMLVQTTQAQALQPPLSYTDNSDKNGGQQPSLWTVPYRRNPFFTGRESLLALLHNQLQQSRSAALTQAQAISGLGGIGKTQTAVEYAYRYRDDYHYVLWVRADTHETLISDYVNVAQQLHLPEQEAQEQELVAKAVRRWLEQNSDWLLILDNADTLKRVHDFLPREGAGHILLTTRSQAVGTIADRLDVEQMGQSDSVLLLMRRAKRLALDVPLEEAREEDRRQAEAIVAELGGLPLALDQAAAYIEETGCALREYLDLYRIHRRSLLERRGETSIDHPESVATTWLLSFQQIEQGNPVAADMLRLCAFLDPDYIPETFIIAGAAKLGPLLSRVADDPFQFNKALEELRKFSLIQRNPETKILSIHRLVQAVLKDNMVSKLQAEWEGRIMDAIDIAFSELDTKGIDENFGLLYQFYVNPIRSYIRRLGKLRADDIDDILQEIFIKLYSRLKDSEFHPVSLRAYLRVIARNTYIEYERKRQRDNLLHLDSDE